MPRQHKKLQVPTKLLGVALPIATFLTLFALLFAGGVPQIGPMPDLLAYVIELAPRTVYAIAIGGAAAVSMHVTGMNLDNEERCDMLRRAAGGNRSALYVLLLETAAWMGWTVVWLFVFRPWS